MPNCGNCGRHFQKLGKHTIDYCIRNEKKGFTINGLCVVIFFRFKIFAPNFIFLFPPPLIQTSSQPSIHSTKHDHVDKPLKCIYCDKRYIYHKARENNEKLCHLNPAYGTALCNNSTPPDIVSPLTCISNVCQTSHHNHLSASDNHNVADDELNFLDDILIDEPNFYPE